MAINLRRTSDAHQRGVKLVVYGQSGSGKTFLIPSLPNPVVLSAEGGLLSIQRADIPYIEIKTMAQLMEAYQWLTESAEAKGFQSVAIDSISEVAEVVLAEELKRNKDGRAAYGELNTVMTGMVRAFRDLPNKHVLFTAKCEKSTDETGRILYAPSMPGKSLSMQLPYLVDEVLALRVEKDADGATQRALMCDSDGLWLAKDRSGALGAWETADLGEIIKKIGGQHAE